MEFNSTKSNLPLQSGIYFFNSPKDVFAKIFLDFLKVCVLKCSYSMDTGGEFMDGCDSTGRSMICGGRIKDRLAQLAMNFT